VVKITAKNKRIEKLNKLSSSPPVEGSNVKTPQAKAPSLKVSIKK
jgi:hypothetical protein